MPKISIIMPARNAEKWIKETIDSIISQSFSDWELICINDASTDKTCHAIRSFRDDRVTLKDNHGKGIISALQLGLSIAKGEFITRMDADDIMPEGRLQLLHDQLHSSPVKTIVTGKVQYFPEASVSKGYLKYQSWLNERIKRNDHWKHVYRECVIASPNWITRKSDLLKHRIFDEMVYPEDYSMCFQWMKSGFQINAVNDTTLLWREHRERTSRNSEIYDQPSFFKLKSREFLYKFNGQTIGLIGVNQKSKEFLKHVADTGNIKWYDIDANNYGSPINNLIVEDVQKINADVLAICVYPENILRLESFLESKGFEIGKNAFYF